MKTTKKTKKNPRYKPEHMSTRALARLTGLDRATVVIRLGWGCGERSANKLGQPTLDGFIGDLDEEEQQKVFRNQIARLIAQGR